MRTVLAVLVAMAACASLAFAPSAFADERKIPLLVIVAGFDGGDEAQAVPYSDDYDWARPLFASENSAFAYYRDMSEGACVFARVAETSAEGKDGNTNRHDRENDGVVHVTLHDAYRPWGLVNEDPAVAADFSGVVKQAFEAAGSYVNFARYDTNRDAVLSAGEMAVVICIPGYDASTLEEPGRVDLPVMWPHSGKMPESTGPGDGQAGTLGLDTYIAITENLWFDSEDISTAMQEPAGIICHELGHYLGLPDFYPLNQDASEESWGAYSTGTLSLMEMGGWAWTPDGETEWHYSPTAFDAWSRYVLGWQLPKVVTETGDYTVPSADSWEGYHSLLIPTSDPDQYFLVENRQPVGHDVALENEYSESNPRGGLVVWHIDKRMYRLYGEENHLNDTDHHPGIMPVYFERKAESYVEDFKGTSPDLGQPFFDAESLVANLGNSGAKVELLLYGNPESEDAPENRVASGITLRVPSQSSDTMTVHVELPDIDAGTASSAYDPPKNPTAVKRFSDNGLGQVACAALLQETGADIALVGAGSLDAGLSGGKLSLADVYRAVPDDATVQIYDASGEQVLALLQSALRLDAPEMVQFGGLACTVDWGERPDRRIGNVRVGDAELDRAATYRIAVTADVVELFGLDKAWERDILVLFGSPADALRSFVQQPHWELATRGVAGSVVYVQEPDVAIGIMQDVTQLVEAYLYQLAAAAAVSLVLALFAAFKLARLRRAARPS